MKTLSVRQPWATLIVAGWKTVENRSWRTSHRGPLAIHAARTIDESAFPDLLADFDRIGEHLTAGEIDEMHRTGVVVGVVDLVDCTQTPTEPEDVKWHNPGAWAWVLRNPHELAQPLAAKGRLGLFDTDVS